jgi:hypothetical protein
MDDKILKKPDVFGGFQALTGSLLADVPGEKNDDNVLEVDTLDDILIDTKNTDDDLDDEGTDDKPVKKKKPAAPVSIPTDDTDEGDDDDNEGDEGDGEPTSGTESELTEFEPDITKFFQDKLASELGWDFEEDEKFESVKDLVDYMKGVVEDASKPNYANDEIEKLNAFVLNGGKLEDYYTKIKPGGIDVDTLDTTKETDAKLAIRERARLQGYKEDRISRAIARYEDSGTLEDEAEEAVEFLKEYKTTSAKKLLEDTENNAKQVKQQQQKFVSTVQDNIKGLNAIRGIPVSNRDKQDLMDYIFKPDSEGLTKYQRDYMSDVKNLIESAYFTKQGDQLISSARKTATSDAYKDLHQKLKASKGKRHTGGVNQGSRNSSDSLTNLLGKTLLKQ